MHIYQKAQALAKEAEQHLGEIFENIDRISFENTKKIAKATCTTDTKTDDVLPDL